MKNVTVELFRDSAREPVITRTDASSNHTLRSGRMNHAPEGHGVQTAQVSPPLVRKSDNRLPVNRSHLSRCQCNALVTSLSSGFCTCGIQYMYANYN